VAQELNESPCRLKSGDYEAVPYADCAGIGRDGVGEAVSSPMELVIVAEAAVAPGVNASGTGRRIAKRGSKRMIAFGWYGGKFSHLDFILPLLPSDATHFCDVFGGSASVLLNVDPYPIETYNDLDCELVNFFEALRNQRSRLIKAISLTPFSREELVRACTPERGLSKLERARRFYVRARQTRTGLAQTSSEGRWAHCVLTSRAGMSGAVSRWLGSIERLPEIAQRLTRAQIENAPAIDVIQRYDTADTVFYLDPPYLHSVRSDSSAYGYEMTDKDHERLAAALQNVRGRVVLSGYRSDLYDRLFKKWRRVDAGERNCHSVRKPRQESAWLNF